MKIEGIGIGHGAKGKAMILHSSMVRSVELNSHHNGLILICQDLPDREFIHKAIFLGVAGLVVPGLHYRDLKSINENELTVVMLARFGVEKIDEKKWERLKTLENREIFLNKIGDQNYEVCYDS